MIMPWRETSLKLPRIFHDRDPIINQTSIRPSLFEKTTQIRLGLTSIHVDSDRFT